MKSYVQQKLDKYVLKFSGEWVFKAAANLGRSEELGKTIETSVPGVVYCRLTNGMEVKAYNKIAPSIWDTHLMLGISKTLPGVWQVIEVREPYAAPQSPFIVNHASQHHITGVDPVFLDRKQTLQVSIIVDTPTTFVCKIYGGIIPTIDGWTMIANQYFDASSYVPDTGALYIGIESDTSGTLSVNEGEIVASKESITASDIPATTAGKYLIGWIMLYESMPKLLNANIFLPALVVTDYLSLDIGTNVHDADEVTELQDDDEVPVWNSLTELIGKITWANIVIQLTALFDTIYSALGHTHDATETTGQYRQFVYEIISGDIVFLQDDDGNPLFNLSDLE